MVSCRMLSGRNRIFHDEMLFMFFICVKYAQSHLAYSEDVLKNKDTSEWYFL